MTFTGPSKVLCPVSSRMPPPFCTMLSVVATELEMTPESRVKPVSVLPLLVASFRAFPLRSIGEVMLNVGVVEAAELLVMVRLPPSVIEAKR